MPIFVFGLEEIVFGHALGTFLGNALRECSSGMFFGDSSAVTWQENGCFITPRLFGLQTSDTPGHPAVSDTPGPRTPGEIPDTNDTCNVL